MKCSKLIIMCIAVHMLTACATRTQDDTIGRDTASETECVTTVSTSATSDAVVLQTVTDVIETQTESVPVDTGTEMPLNTVNAENSSETNTMANIDYSTAVELPVIHYDAYTDIIGTHEAYDFYDVESMTENTLYRLTRLDDGSMVYGVFETGAFDEKNHKYVVANANKQTVYVTHTDGTSDTFVQDWFVNYYNAAPSGRPVDIFCCDINKDKKEELLFTYGRAGNFAQYYSELAVCGTGTAQILFDSQEQDKLISDNINTTIDKTTNKITIVACGETFEREIDASLAEYTDTPQADFTHVYFEISNDAVYTYVGVRCGVTPMVVCYIRLRLTLNDGGFAFSEPSVIPFSESRFA